MSIDVLHINPLHNGVNKKAAFFDVDDTLINIKTMFSFFYFLKHKDEWGQLNWFSDFEIKLSEMMSNGTKREDVNRFYYKLFTGMSVESLESKVACWFEQTPVDQAVLNEAVVSCLIEHQNNNHDVVFVSGSCSALLKPLGDLLSVSNFICAPLEIIDGRYTGNLTGHPTIGQGKAQGIQAYASANQLSLDDCFAYGDDISDVPMLSAVGQPRFINPNDAMLAHYQSNNRLVENSVIRF